jgi:MoaA/NifB/PqqE/SkfB family radical SAM enzyme
MRFLNPLVALIINCLIKIGVYEDVVIELTQLLKQPQEVVVHKISLLMRHIEHYINIVKDQQMVVDLIALRNENKVIIRQSRELDTPYPKALTPHKIKFYLTESCYRNCVYCFAGAKLIKKNEFGENCFLTVERFKDIIIETDNIGVKSIELSGGDPFTLENIVEYIKVMTENFHHDWAISTKAHISKEMANKIQKVGLREMQVSLDSFVPTTVDIMLGVRNSFDDLIDTIKNLQDANINVSVKAVITAINIDSIPNYLEKCLLTGIMISCFQHMNS